MHICTHQMSLSVLLCCAGEGCGVAHQQPGWQRCCVRHDSAGGAAAQGVRQASGGVHGGRGSLWRLLHRRYDQVMPIAAAHCLLRSYHDGKHSMPQELLVVSCELSKGPAHLNFRVLPAHSECPGPPDMAWPIWQMAQLRRATACACMLR